MNEIEKFEEILMKSSKIEHELLAVAEMTKEQYEQSNNESMKELWKELNHIYCYSVDAIARFAVNYYDEKVKVLLEYIKKFDQE